MARKPERKASSYPAWQVALAYAVVGTLYILFSDTVVEAFGFTPAVMMRIGMMKGVAFVLTTSLVLFGLLRQKRIIGTRTLSALRRRASDADFIASAMSKGDPGVDLIQAHNALAESEERMRLIIDAAAEAIVISDEQGMILTWNQAAQRMFQRSGEEAIGKEWAAVIAAEADRGRCRETLGRTAAGASPVRFELTGRRKDGETFPIELSVITVAWGPRVLHTAFIRDLTDTVRAEREAEHVAAIVNASPDAIFAVDANGAITSWNPAAVRTFALDVETARSSRLDRLVAAKDDTTVNWLLDNIARGIPIESSPVECMRNNGESFRAFVSVSPITAGGVITGAAVIIRDASEQLSARDRVKDAELLATMGRLAAAVGHQFNNVLMGIMPFVDVLKRIELPPQASRAVEQIAKSVEKGRRVTGDIQAFTRSSEAPMRRSVPMDRWLEGLRSDLESTLGPMVELVIDVADEIALAADPSKLRHVFLSLATNARGAMPEGGRFTIAVRDSPATPPHAVAGEDAGRQWAEIVVRDTGEGIDEESQRRIFEPLFAKHRGGSGLELATVQQIVRSHGGAIEVSSERGQGTSFRILLPRAVPEERPSAVHAPVPDQSASRRVLLVEDDPMVAVGLTQALVATGMHVDVVRTGARVMHAVRAFSPEVVVLDIQLPDANGFDVYREIAATWPSLPVIFSTGHADEYDEEAAEPLSRPNVELLRKPYPTEDLLAAMSRVLAPTASRERIADCGLRIAECGGRLDERPRTRTLTSCRRAESVHGLCERFPQNLTPSP
jgi:PAS domain S-box-containing protein